MIGLQKPIERMPCKSHVLQMIGVKFGLIAIQESTEFSAVWILSVDPIYGFIDLA